MAETLAPKSPAAAARGDVRRPRGKRPRPMDGGRDVQITQSATGWLTAKCRAPGGEILHYLAAQADFAGPVKLRCGPMCIVKEFEVFLPARSAAGQGWSVDPEEAEEVSRLRAQIAELASAMLDGQVDLGDWDPPGASLLAGWLAEGQRAAAADKQGDLRLTVHRDGCDGQVRIACGSHGLRVVMPLGHWPQLSPVVRQAIQRLAGEANDRARLVRIACTPSEVGGPDGLRVEAQVDLSGLPAANQLNRATEAMWREMVHLAIDGMELTLWRLGLELPVLADPRSSDLAELLVRQTERGIIVTQEQLLALAEKRLPL